MLQNTASSAPSDHPRTLTSPNTAEHLFPKPLVPWKLLSAEVHEAFLAQRILLFAGNFQKPSWASAAAFLLSFPLLRAAPQVQSASLALVSYLAV